MKINTVENWATTSKLSKLARSILIGCIVYGGYLAFAQQRIANAIRAETKLMEKSFENELDQGSASVTCTKLDGGTGFHSWLFQLPPRKALEVHLQSSEPMTSTLLRIPSHAKSHYALIQLEFFGDEANPQILRRFRLFAPDFVQVEHEAELGCTYLEPDFLLDRIAVGEDPFKQREQKHRLQQRQRFFEAPLEVRVRECSAKDCVALCYFAEGEPMLSHVKQLKYLLKAVAIDE